MEALLSVQNARTSELGAKVDALGSTFERKFEQLRTDMITDRREYAGRDELAALGVEVDKLWASHGDLRTKVAGYQARVAVYAGLAALIMAALSSIFTAVILRVFSQ